MQNPLIIGLIVFGVILVGAFAGCVIKERLPKHLYRLHPARSYTVLRSALAKSPWEDHGKIVTGRKINGINGRVAGAS
jgi:uncharacterized membrane protein